MAGDVQQMDQVFRERAHLAGKYCLDNPGNRFNHVRLLRQISEGIGRVGLCWDNIRVLDLGAGELLWGEEFSRMGMPPHKYIGTDLLRWRLLKGHELGRNFGAVTASAQDLPFASGSFDLVTQFTMMTSVLDEDTRRRIAAELTRVLKPGGYFLWYDFRINNPWNPHTRAIRQGELRRLFAGWPVACETITLLPPIARKTPKALAGILKFLHAVPILRTHYLALIGPKG